MNLKKAAVLSAALFFMFALLFNPKASTEGAIKGLYLCGRVIIPSLFTFCICVYMIMRSKIKFFSNCYAVFLLSLIGGYPVGTALTEELYREGLITKKGADMMHCCCVNGGPAFIIIAVGLNMLGSQSLGVALFICHILPSVLFMLIILPKIRKESVSVNNHPTNYLNIGDLFTGCVRDAADSVMGICSYVILFSCLTQLMNENRILSSVSCLLEVTSAVKTQKNIYLIAFLLGFAGISIWMQVSSVAEKSRINFFTFAASRILHGLLSMLFLKLYVIAAKPQIPVFSTLKESPDFTVSGIETAVCILILGAVLILSLENENNCRKSIKNLLK